MSVDPFRSDEYLDRMSHEGDPRADALIAELLASGEYPQARAALLALDRNDAPLSEAMPKNLREFLHETAQLPAWADVALLDKSAAFFERHGPCILMMLGCYALPMSYAAHRGVKVLYRSSKFMGHTDRRAIETTQMVADVLERGGLQARGRGLRTIQKVRLMHAVIRAQLLRDVDKPWDKANGLPINQEDMVGTLLCFSFVVLDGFRKLGTPIPDDQAEAFLHTWKLVGYLMGMREELLPHNVADADAMAHKIKARQFAYSPEGCTLTRQLIDMMEYNTPGRVLDGLPNALMFHFLGDEAAAMVGLRQPDWTRLLVRFGQWLGGVHIKVDDHCRACALLSERFAHAYVYGLLLSHADERSPSFMLPQGLLDKWQMSLFQYRLQG